MSTQLRSQKINVDAWRLAVCTASTVCGSTTQVDSVLKKEADRAIPLFASSTPASPFIGDPDSKFIAYFLIINMTRVAAADLWQSRLMHPNMCCVENFYEIGFISARLIYRFLSFRFISKRNSPGSKCAPHITLREGDGVTRFMHVKVNISLFRRPEAWKYRLQRKIQRYNLISSGKAARFDMRIFTVAFAKASKYLGIKW